MYLILHDSFSLTVEHFRSLANHSFIPSSHFLPLGLLPCTRSEIFKRDYPSTWQICLNNWCCFLLMFQHITCYISSLLCQPLSLSHRSFLFALFSDIVSPTDHKQLSLIFHSKDHQTPGYNLKSPCIDQDGEHTYSG